MFNPDAVLLLPRPGFVVGHAGLYQGIAMFLVAYFIICMTVLSVCAISTNGALDAGGAYCILQCVGRARVLSVVLAQIGSQKMHFQSQAHLPLFLLKSNASGEGEAPMCIEEVALFFFFLN